MTEQFRSAKPMLKFNRQFFTDAWVLLKPFWISKGRGNAWSLLLLNIVCVLVVVWGTVGINHFNKEFFDALGAFDKPAIIVSLGHFLEYLIILILAFGYNSYLTSLVSIRWQRWLTGYYLDKWLAHHAYYQLEIAHLGMDNPDQRIAEDLGELASGTLRIFFALFQSVLTLGSFGYILWGLSGKISIPIGSYHLVIPGFLCFAAFIFAAVGTYVNSKIGRRLSGLNYSQQQRSANFRYSLVRVREASEQIAMSRGERVEKAKLDGLFANVYQNFIQIIGLQRNLDFFVNGYNNVSSVIGIFFAMPLYLSKQINLGGMMQISGAFNSVLGAFSVFINSYYQLTEWRAVIHRLTEFNQLLQRLQKDGDERIHLSKSTSPNLVLEHLTLSSSLGKILLNQVNHEFARGSSILISGSTGIGKSTLLRALAGVWKRGHGKIQLPENAKILFLSQKPYLSLGSLKDVLLYPHNVVMDDERLTEVLEKCLLSTLKDELDVVKNWSQVLSLGEQQLLMFARIFLYQPDIVFLDESTSALDEAKEIQIYQNVRAFLPHTTIISVGHRSSLRALHDERVTLIDGRLLPEKHVIESLAV